MSMQPNDLFLVIKTNSYTGNFERELMAFVFGFEEDEFEDYWLERQNFWAALNNSELDLSDYGDGDESPFAYFFNVDYFGRRYSEYHCAEILSHPENEKYDCDSIIIALRQDIPTKFKEFMFQRLQEFTEYMASLEHYPQKIKIVDVDYFTLSLTRRGNK
ncbi:MAG: hypothetical protein J6A25_07205 [Lachnospiraceae bacterium]|nr:hypothetical protein [Lachnospiraceae bacterium]